MLSSIHPLGERARNNRWWLTTGAFTLGAVMTGSLLGAAAGGLGGVVLSLSPIWTLIATAIALLAAGLLDVLRVDPPGPTRQVNEHWIGHYRGWVYGGAFGVQLGAGFTTYIVTWGVYAVLAGALLTMSMPLGALVGAVFGLGRSIPLLLTAWIDRPSRLTTFHRQMARLGPVLSRSAAIVTTGLGALTLAVLVI